METENYVCIIRCMDDIYKRPLKEAGSRAIEDALKKAICDLTGEEYELDIRTIDFGDDSHSFIWDRVTITLTTGKPFKGFEGIFDEKKLDAPPA